MTALTVPTTKLPAALANLAALATREAFDEFSSGVVSGFPIISYKGKVWRIRKGGEETLHVDENNDALPSIEIVLVQANPALSKIFYEKSFEEGTNEAPRCFSNDSVRPDPSVENPIHSTCALCPKNQWGSRITDNGKKARACSDSRRMAVVFANDLAEKGTDCMKLLLRVPPASLNPLKDYIEKMLAPKGVPPFAIVTRISFDVSAAHPQFIFKPARLVTADEANAIVQLRGSEDMRRILAEAQEFPAAAADDDADDDANVGSATAPAVAAAPAPTTAAAAKPSKVRAATEEEAALAAVLGNATPAPAAAAKPASKKTAAKPAAAKPAAQAVPAPAATEPSEEEEEEASPAPAAPGSADFNSLLDQILGG